MKLLWSVLALLLLAAAWALRDPGGAVPESCDPPPWDLLDQARRDETATRKPDGAGIDGASTPVASPRDRSNDGDAGTTAPSAAPAATTTSADPTAGSTAIAAMPPGAGTERQPFRISWDLLGRASGHVRGDGTIAAMPRELELIGGTWIELSGFYAPAIIAPSTDEVMLMLNRWDGCCIGLPPTPYDSVMVKMRGPIDFSLQHQIRFGTLRGRLALEPFALGGVVLGLYRLEDADLLR